MSDGYTRLKKAIPTKVEIYDLTNFLIFFPILGYIKLFKLQIWKVLQNIILVKRALSKSSHVI